ncbi:hypothetical protein P7H90_11620 [Lactococcus lactis]|uniref:hypothetical protein n=1 Tax=Lactococcus TaxID=1357 RepID=UPI00288EB4FF|nr:hypothetical protein [Lactococcus lactis]MDT2871604.1 hypothetical protein [Lactococcus lactis]MDT2874248.1 hypothetical protein [Lactococcus lactis]MDT2876869.1 hypothetical protein [Lactococcus lactis]MDT2890645.1 hypothetical protein [Lactococcus lactis]MDT2893180.1 hypothetical protein [Lactococcus lactis]
MKNNNYKLGLILSISLFVLTFISTVILSIFAPIFVKTSAGFECFSIALLFFFTQKYGEQTVSKENDFWITRKFNLGVSINPHTKTSKRITTFLICLLVLGGFLLIFL